jgi:type VI secretion system protein ImpC
VAIDGRRERELARNGFIALVHRSDSDTAVFLSTPSLGKPAEYADVEAAANARRATQLPYVFANCRIAHYLHAIVRDRFAASTDRQRVQQWLQNWIATYVDSDSATPEPITQSSKPLAAATISVEQAPEDPTALTATFYIRLND